MFSEYVRTKEECTESNSSAHLSKAIVEFVPSIFCLVHESWERRYTVTSLFLDARELTRLSAQEFMNGAAEKDALRKSTNTEVEG